MKPVLIVENSTNSLIREHNAHSNKKDYVLSGTFTEFGVKNRNERVYTADKFLPALGELNERISNLGVVYGEFDHPDVFDTSLSRASHIVTKAKYISERNLVAGEIKLLSTYWGKEAKSLVDDGLPVFVSSRAAGVTESDGSVSLKKLFTYDIVADPGFASAKMSVNVLNESLGYGVNKSNFRIYEMSDESKINELFNMNKNEFVTKKQLTDYSHYLVNELASTKREVKSAISKGNITPKKLDQLLEYYEELNETNSQVVKYLDYLAEKVQIVFNENKELKSTASRLARHNDYLAENLEKAINYSEYVAEKVDKNIDYSEYIAEKVDKNIDYSEYIAEKVDKSIDYSEYIAEKVDKNIDYAEYIAENLDKNIDYSEYIAENVDNSIAYSEYLAENVESNIAYSEYIAENLDNNIAYSEYIAENLDNNIAYSEYIAENLDDNIAYSEYIAESLDKSVNYQGLIVEKLNRGRLYESNDAGYLPSPEQAGFEDVEDENEIQNEYDDYDGYAMNDYEDEDLESLDGYPGSDEYDDDYEDYVIKNYGDGDGYSDSTYDRNYKKDMYGEDCEECGDEIHGNDDTELSNSINKLIEEAKKRKVSETSDMNFLKFLNKSQVDSFYALSNDEQETVKLHINERSYFTQKEVLSLISEALSAKNESLEQRVVRLMPENIKPIWNQLNESSKISLISQARLYPEEVLRTEGQVEHFWNTRNLKKNESVTKRLVSNDALIQEDRMSDREANLILERFRSL